MLLRRLTWLLLCLGACLTMGFGPARLTNGDLARRSFTAPQLRALRQVPLPQVSAKAAILVHSGTGQVLFAHNEHQRRPVGSLVKIVTALVALQQGRLDRDIRITDADLAVYSVLYIQGGEMWSLRELLNAASMAIARGVGKDVRTFVRSMNDLVTSWGLKNTRFANPSGLDAKDAYSSAYDMAIIGYRAIHDETIAEVVRHFKINMGGRAMQSTNELLNTYPGTVGLKTGTTDLAGDCFLGVVDRPAGEVICVVLDAKDRFLDTRRLLDYFYASFAELRIDLPPSPQNRYQDESGQWREFKLREPVTMLVRPWQAGTALFYRRIDNPTATPRPDEPIGVLQVQLAGQPLTEVPLYAR
jgi:D-alanyl-D-alanine carboxypeptidase